MNEKMQRFEKAVMLLSISVLVQAFFIVNILMRDIRIVHLLQLIVQRLDLIS